MYKYSALNSAHFRLSAYDHGCVSWQPKISNYLINTHTHIYMHTALLIWAGDKGNLWKKNGFPLCSYWWAHHTTFSHQVWYSKPLHWFYVMKYPVLQRWKITPLSVFADHLSESNSQQEFPSILFSFPAQLISNMLGKKEDLVCLYGKCNADACLKQSEHLKAERVPSKWNHSAFNFHLPTVLFFSFFF